jgi:Ni,Fe-hydrogenase III small subunit
VRQQLRRAGFARPRVFLLTWPGGRGTRLVVEHQCRRTGWPLVDTPADADLLIIAAARGEDRGSARRAVEERIWRAIPEPRQCVLLTRGDDIAAALAAAHQQLLHPTAALNRSPGCPGQPGAVEHASASGHAPPEQQPHGTHSDHGANAAAHSMAMTGPTGTGGHHMDTHAADHAGMQDMPMPAGLPLASDEDDRDGLRLDVVHVSLGPALTLWPEGLQVELTLQGDVAAAVSVQVWPGEPDAEPVSPTVAALDAVARLLLLAGADRAAELAAQYRDQIFTGQPHIAEDELAALRDSVARARLLRSMLRRVPVLDPSTGRSHHVWTALRCWLDTAAAGAAAPELPGWMRPPVNALAAILQGRELAEVRLIVAALDLRPDPAVAPGPSAVGSGAAHG